MADTVIQRIKPDWVFHLAGSFSGTPADIYRANLSSGISVLEAVRSHKPDARILVVGSAAEYGPTAMEDMPLTEEHPCRPTSSYGLAKYGLTQAAVEYWARWNIKVVAVRPFNIVGAGVPASLLLGALLERVKAAVNSSDPVVAIGRTDTERDFVAVEDVVWSYDQLIRGEHWGEVFNICSGCPESISSVAQRLLAVCPRPIRLELDSALVRPNDAQSVYGSWRKANSHFGFRPSINLDDALRSAWEHVLGNAL
jgi:GDP-4-dehydro-6-deoxy-D-mannose reductase